MLDCGLPKISNHECVLGIILIIPSSTGRDLGKKVEISLLIGFYLGKKSCHFVYSGLFGSSNLGSMKYCYFLHDGLLEA